MQEPRTISSNQAVKPVVRGSSRRHRVNICLMIKSRARDAEIKHAGHGLLTASTPGDPGGQVL